MAVYLASPTVPAALLQSVVWAACQHTMFGWDGSEWDLSSGMSGIALQAGTRGMRPPPHQRYATKAASLPGSIYRGSVTDERDVFWPVKLFSDAGSQAWIDHNHRFWRTLDPDELNTWVITQPSGERRSLQVRYAGLSDDSDDIDPALVGLAEYGIQLVAEQPYWLGDPLTRRFDHGGGQNYYGGDSGGGYGPPFYISPGLTTDTASITNDGDVPIWPVWKVNGPTTSVTVGVNGHLTVFPMTLTSGQWVRLDMAPTDQVPIDQAGVDRSADMGAVDFAEIPRGANVPLTIAMTGTGFVEVTIVPAYRWGM